MINQFIKPEVFRAALRNAGTAVGSIVTVRMSPVMKRRLESEANQEGCSLNALVLRCLEGELKARTEYRKTTRNPS